MGIFDIQVCSKLFSLFVKVWKLSRPSDWILGFFLYGAWVFNIKLKEFFKLTKINHNYRGMFRKINNFFKKFDEKILKGGENAEPKSFNFKGQRYIKKHEIHLFLLESMRNLWDKDQPQLENNLRKGNSNTKNQNKMNF